MLCPKCKQELIIVERDDIALDYCIHCNGFWFDDDEWNLLCKRLYSTAEDFIGNIYSIPKLIVKEEIRNCPICNSKMEKFMAYGVILDRCPNHHGIWFDKNEISTFINSSTGNKEKNPVNFLGEVFFK